MIQRLVDGLRALLHDPADARAAGDLADAIRLELDCMQQDLAPPQRASLRRLLDTLDVGAPPADVRRAAVDAASALGVL